MSLLKSGWLADEHLIIVELGERDEPKLPTDFEIFDIRKYGKTKLFFCCLKR